VVFALSFFLKKLFLVSAFEFKFPGLLMSGLLVICEGLTPVKFARGIPWLRPWEICQGFHAPVKILDKSTYFL